MTRFGIVLVSLLSGLIWTGAAADIQPPQAAPRKFPVRGKIGPGLEPLDEAVIAILERHGIPGASAAIAYKGKLLFTRGYGWAELEGDRVAEANTLMGVASLSKPITALAILRLVEEGKLGLDDLAFELLKHIPPPPGARVDPRLAKITVRQLLNHSGGWNRTKSGDPVNWSPQIARRMGWREPITAEQFLSYMLTVPLDFDPGTDFYYSNVGYIALGKIVEKVSGQPYEAFIRKTVLEPLGMKGTRLHHNDFTYYPGEARRYLAGTGIALPPLRLPMIAPAGGWSSTAVDLARLLTALDGSRGKSFLKKETYRTMMELPPGGKRRANGIYCGLGFHSVLDLPGGGYEYFQDGSFQGMRAFMKRNAKGANIVLLFNASMNPDPIDAAIVKDALHEVRARVEQHQVLPDVDFFD
jgi:N-acyl-D-amino-acid deacylase